MAFRWLVSWGRTDLCIKRWDIEGDDIPQGFEGRLNEGVLLCRFKTEKVADKIIITDVDNSIRQLASPRYGASIDTSPCVIIYSESSFKGKSQVLQEGYYRTDRLQYALRNYHDAIGGYFGLVGSMRIKPGTKVRIFNNWAFQGSTSDNSKTIIIDHDVSSLNDFNRSAQAPVEYFTHPAKETFMQSTWDRCLFSMIVSRGEHGILEKDIYTFEDKEKLGFLLCDTTNDRFGENSIFATSSSHHAAAVIGIHHTNQPSPDDKQPVVGNGVFGESNTNDGVAGLSWSNRHAGVAGANYTQNAVVGIDSEGNPIISRGFGVWGFSKYGVGVAANSSHGIGLSCSGKEFAAKFDGSVSIRGNLHVSHNLRISGDSHGIVLGLEKNGGGKLIITNNSGDNSIYLEGFSSDESKSAEAIHITGRGSDQIKNIFLKAIETVAQGNFRAEGSVIAPNLRADCAEEFDICESVEADPGSVMVVGANGILHPCQQAYDKRVAGVISGAGCYKPAIVLDSQQNPTRLRKPIALLGKVCCKVDAQYGAIEVGDLLTTSPTPGHAMKACDPQQAFGSVIGKALEPCTEGTGLIPILIALQ